MSEPRRTRRTARGHHAERGQPPALTSHTGHRSAAGGRAEVRALSLGASRPDERAPRRGPEPVSCGARLRRPPAVARADRPPRSGIDHQGDEHRRSLTAGQRRGLPRWHLRGPGRSALPNRHREMIGVSRNPTNAVRAPASSRTFQGRRAHWDAVPDSSTWDERTAPARGGSRRALL